MSSSSKGSQAAEPSSHASTRMVTTALPSMCYDNAMLSSTTVGEVSAMRSSALTDNSNGSVASCAGDGSVCLPMDDSVTDQGGLGVLVANTSISEGVPEVSAASYGLMEPRLVMTEVPEAVAVASSLPGAGAAAASGASRAVFVASSTSESISTTSTSTMLTHFRGDSIAMSTEGRTACDLSSSSVIHVHPEPSVSYRFPMDSLSRPPGHPCTAPTTATACELMCEPEPPLRIIDELPFEACTGASPLPSSRLFGSVPPRAPSPITPPVRCPQFLPQPAVSNVCAPAVQCKCKAGYCRESDCYECRKCCSVHGSRKKIGKEGRPVGRPKRGEERAKSIRLANDRDTMLPRSAKPTSTFSGLLTPVTTPRQNPTPSPAIILESLGYSKDAVNRLTRHLPPRNMRHDPSFWEQDGDIDAAQINHRLATMRLYREILVSVASSLCESEDAAVASLETFAMWLKPDPAQPRHQAVARSCMQAVANAKKGSTECRLVRATLCGTFKLKDLDELAEDAAHMKINHSTYHASKKDFERLLRGEQFSKPLWSRKKFKEATARRAIEFILAYENVAYLSWGTKRIRLNGVSHDVPSILRKKPTTVIYQQYVDMYKDKKLRISRSSFFRVCDELTNGEVKPRKCIDYVSGFLVYDTFDTLARILTRVSPATAASLQVKLDIVQAWLKYGHGIGRESPDGVAGCPRHDIEFGLTKPDGKKPVEPRPMTCPQCRSLHRLFSHVLNLIRAAEVDSSAEAVFHDIRHKINLFMGHRLRVVNQQQQIASMIAEAKRECETNGSTDLAVVLIDFKMKAEPIYFREKTSDHYGKRGMSWHGVLIRTWELHRESEASAPFVRENIVYYDQLSNSDNKQDKGAVLSLLEATMMAIRRQLPHIKRIIVQSDNASCYQNSCVILMLPILGHYHGVRVERYEHTDTQDGKSPLDGHFGQAQHKVRRFVKQGNNCVTPTQYLVALGADGGLPNCVGELVQYDRPKLGSLLQSIAPLEAELSKLVKRPNDVYYEFPEIATTTPFKITSCPDFFLRAFSYSAIGSGDYIRVSPRASSCVRVHEAVDAAQNDDPGEDNENEDDLIGRTTMEEISTTSREITRDREAVDGEGEVEEASQQPLTYAAGSVTGVTIVKTAQLIPRICRGNVCQSQPHDNAAVDEDNKDLVSFAKKQLLALCGSTEIGIVDARDLAAKLETISDDLPECDEESLLLFLGWARRPPNGSMYGAKYIHLFRDQIRVMFEEGANESGDKLGAGRMLEKLLEENDDRFDLPSEAEVRAEISRLYNLSKKRKHGNEGIEHGPPSKRPRMSKEYAAFLGNLLQENPTEKPIILLDRFREEFPDSTTALTDLQIRNKLNALKRKTAKEM